MTDVKTETPTVELTLDAAPVLTLANTGGDALAPRAMPPKCPRSSTTAC